MEINEVAKNNIKYYASIIINDLRAEGFSVAEALNFIKGIAWDQLKEEAGKLK